MLIANSVWYLTQSVRECQRPDGSPSINFSITGVRNVINFVKKAFGSLNSKYQSGSLTFLEINNRRTGNRNKRNRRQRQGNVDCDSLRQKSRGECKEGETRSNIDEGLFKG